MQVLVLLLLAAVMLADQGLGASWSAESIPPWLPPLVAFLPPVACVVLEYVLIRRTLRLAVGGSPASILRAGTRLRVLQWIVVGCSVVSLAGLGWLELVRAATGDVVVLDELLSILPALFLLAMLWWVQWPLERLLRESLLIRRLDEGLPVHPVPSAAGYVLWQFRTHLLLVLVPVLMILALVESAELAVSLLRPGSGIAPVAAGAAGLLGIVLAPFTMRLAVGAVPLADGPVRRAMEQVLREAGVRVRDILVWPTGTSMLNGAVIGVFPATRFVLLTDGLLELLSLDQVRAVMAHEAGHLRHRHLPWTAAMLFALVALVGQLVEWIVNPVFRLALETGADPGRLQSAFELVAVVVVLGVVFIGFGAVSRRLELQADAAAARDLALGHHEGDRVTPEASALVASALESVARYNGMDPARHTWRHGSIRWRQSRLARLVGRPIDDLPIDRQVRLLKAGTILVILAISLAWFVGEAPA